jgi:hypothetical protein
VLQGVTSQWAIPAANQALNREIEGYASATSINRGESINLYVKTIDPTYTISVYRVGWYDGVGGRLVHASPTLSRVSQPACNHDTTTHLVECNWVPSYTLSVPNDTTDPTDWASGYYLAKLTSAGGKQSYIVFVVRDDNRPSDFLFQASVTTYATYNEWSDVKDANGNFINYGSYTTPAATKVSFNRPYEYIYTEQLHHLKGAGFFLEWESSLMRFMEREGYDVSYQTSIDTHRNGALLLNHKSFLSVGHDEYWSKEIRGNIEAAKSAGVNLAFIGANAAYWQIRLEPSSVATGSQPDRTVVAYRDNWPSDPYNAIDPLLVTKQWRDLSRPEAALIGVQYIYNSLDQDMVISDCSSWICDGTISPNDATKRLQPGDKLPGMLGYEVDAIVASSPANIQVIASSPFVCDSAFSGCANSPTKYSHMTYYTTPSNAKIFATGSMNWNWGLDNSGPYNGGRINVNVQQITRNVLNSFISSPLKLAAVNSILGELPSDKYATENAPVNGGGCAMGGVMGQYDISLLLLLFSAAVFRYRAKLRSDFGFAKNSFISMLIGSNLKNRQLNLSSINTGRVYE